MLGRPASEKCQGTKSREVGAPSVPRALWGFGRGVRLDEVGSRRRSVALRRGMGVGIQQKGKTRTNSTVRS
jgi:hypothetical protein